MKKTSVELLEDAINEVLSHLPLEREEIKMLIEKAKETRKNEIKESFEAGRSTGSTGFTFVNGEYYYNETFKTK